MTHTDAAYKRPISGKGPTQTESEGLETNFPSKQTGKKSQGIHNQIKQNRFQKKAINRDPEGHFIILKGRRHKHCKYIYTPNIGAPKYIKKILEDFLKKFLLLLNYSCMPFLPIPPPHPR